MPLVYPGSAAIPQYESSLAAFMPGFDRGQSDRRDSNAFDAAAKAFGKPGTTPVKEPTFLERLAGPFTRPQPGQTATAAIEAAVPQTPAQRPAPVPAMGSDMTGYIANARAAESGGNDQAANPNSSALGRYQFLESTWNGLAQQYPELGLTPDGRTDPAQQERAMAQFTKDNAGALSQAGVQVNPGTLYAAHFLGAGGATKALTADPATPMSALVEPAVIQANPQLQGMTAGDFAQWANGKGGNQSGGYQPPMRDEGAGQGQPYTPDADTMRTLLASEATRPLAMSLIQAGQETEASRGRFVTEQGQDGSIWQRDTLTGAKTVLQQAKAPEPRRMVQGPDGNQYYEDGTRVLPGVEAPVAGPDFADTTKLRTEIQQLPSYKNIAQALPIYRSMQEAAGRNTKASDLNLVYGLGKIFDPTSVVREGEMVLVQNTASLPDWLQGAIASLNGGATLSPDTRAAIMTEAYGRIQGYDTAFQQDATQYQEIAGRNKINPADVIPDFGEYAPWEPATPAGATAPTDPAAPSTPQVPIIEGTVIENDQGQRLVLRNGQWEPQ